MYMVCVVNRLACAHRILYVVKCKEVHRRGRSIYECGLDDCGRWLIGYEEMYMYDCVDVYTCGKCVYV